MVIVEYCRFGNILDHMIRHRAVFIDETDRQNDSSASSFIENLITEEVQQ